jgi:hypothetical protein
MDLIMRLFALLCLLSLLSACSSNLSKGNNMMEAEQFHEAVRYYEKAMLDDPGDTEVATKLYEARTRMVLADLIKVRLQRQSNQHRAAALVLNDSLYSIIRWKIIADSGVKATIEEEVLEAGVWLDKELETLAKKADHNAFFYTLKQFNHILNAGYADNTVSQYKPGLQRQGQQQCRKMKGQLTPQSYYLHDIWLAYCGVFAIEGNYQLNKDTTRYAGPKILSRGLKISNGAGITSRDIAELVERNIKQHPWFSPRAISPLSLSMAGRVNYDLSSKPKTFTRRFMAYDETLELVKDPKDPKKIIRKLVHREKVPKSISFKGKEYTETYAHSVSVKAKLKTSVVDAFSQQAKKIQLMPAHNTYFKEEGIKPLSPKFKDKESWKNQISNGLVNQIKQDLDQAWIYEFCNDQKIDTKLSKNEYAVRCSELKPHHALVNAWAQSEFGLGFDQLTIMLGRN